MKNETNAATNNDDGAEATSIMVSFHRQSCHTTTNIIHISLIRVNADARADADRHFVLLLS
jgi:hypothetical protein